MSILPPFETSIGRVGLTICFDVRFFCSFHNHNCLVLIHSQLRFPEISLALKRQNAQIITYPSAFTVPTGQVHWETLLRARAIETQTYVLAAAQVGAHNEKRISYGHSMIVDPWGKILAELTGEGKEPEIAIANINLEYREKIYREMPLLRRTSV